MKKFLLKTLFILLAIVSFNSCTIENNDTYPNGYPQIVQIFYGNWTPGTINANGQYIIGGYTTGQTRAAMTRAAVSQTYDDKFSLWAWTSDSTVMDGYHGVFGTTNNQPTWGYTEDAKYFDNFVSEYNFIGVIPQSDSHVYDATNHTVTVAADTFTVASTDLNYKDDHEILYATTTVQKANYAGGASLAFNNLNSKVYLQFTSDDANTQILDFTPYTPANPGSPAIPGTPGTETYTSKSTKFIDELVAGNEVQVGIGFVGANSPKLTSGNPTTLYVGSNNTTYNYMAKDWLLSIKDAVNSQFVYYRLNAVANSTSKTETTEDWESAASNKNIFMMKLADGVNATDFANGNDAFMNALTAHEADWFGGSPATTFKSMFEQAYAEGWRVIRINVSDANANQVLVFLSNNQNITTQVCEVTGGTPGTPAVPATPESGHKGIIMLPATSANGTGTDAVLSTFPASVNASISLNGVNWETTATGNSVTFDKPTDVAYTTPVQSPTTFFTFPASVANTSNLGYTIKFSYNYKGVNVYDARIFIPSNVCNWQSAKYYIYKIHITDRGNGKADPTDPTVDPTDPTIPTGVTNYQITVNAVSITGYTGETWNYNGTTWTKQ